MAEPIWLQRSGSWGVPIQPVRTFSSGKFAREPVLSQLPHSGLGIVRMIIEWEEDMSQRWANAMPVVTERALVVRSQITYKCE